MYIFLLGYLLTVVRIPAVHINLSFLMHEKLYHEASVYMTFGKNKGAINKFSKILENAKNIEESSFITALIQRATCYYREKMCKDGYNCSKRIAYLKKLDLDILVNSNAGDSQNRGRSQSANR
ncbi:unnamed protein product [Rotaria socialis]|uniref:Uncharacterized protein n=1 Tax=Rotaria socialis TaxID=392032 RepID=A0A820C8Q6_9BILA|nr:unnamed protein product [Rotaria socialis]